MNIKSISELDETRVALNKLSVDCHTLLEVDQNLNGTYTSLNMKFGAYTAQIVNELTSYYEVIDRKILACQEFLPQIQDTIDISVQYMYEKLQAFILSSHDEFVHKNEDWRYNTETIYGPDSDKIFTGDSAHKGKVHISGDTSLLQVEHVIEGITRNTYYDA